MSAQPLTHPARSADQASLVVRCRWADPGTPEQRAWCRLSGPDCGFVLILSGVVHRLSTDSAGGVRIERVLSPLVDLGEWDSDDQLSEVAIDVTLLPAVRAAAKLRGVTLVDDFDDRDGLGPLEATAIRNLRQVDYAAIEMVANHGRGIVWYHPSAAPETIAAGIAAAFANPNRKIVIVASTTRQCSRLLQQLRSCRIDAVRLRSGRPAPRAECGVIVTTPQQLPRAGSLHSIDLYIAVDAREGLNSAYGLDPPARTFELDDSDDVIGRPWPVEQSYDPTQPVRPALLRRVGLLPTDAIVTPGEQGRLFREFGFLEAIVFPEGAEPPKVNVEWMKLRSGPGGGPHQNPADHYRHCLWRNPVRNRRLANIAREAAADGSRVLVLAGGPEHAAAFSRLLRGWPIRITRVADLAGLTASDQRVLASADPDARGCRLIATASAAIPDARRRSSLRPVDFDVVIRANGGTGLIPLLCDPPGVPSMRCHTVRLVDCTDRFQPHLRREARRRANEYARQGWFGCGIDPVQERARLFVLDCINRVHNLAKE